MHKLTTRVQLLRILGGISIKRHVDVEAQEPEAKRARTIESSLATAITADGLDTV